MDNYIILLPPSEGKKTNGDETKAYRIVKNLKKYNYFTELESDREYVYNKLREAIGELLEIDLERIFDVKGKNLQIAVEIISDMLNEFTMPAITRYDGVMYKAIDYSGMNEKQKQKFDNSVIIVDGMFGLLKPYDYIPNYKLKISAKYLDVDVTKFWKLQLRGIFDHIFKNKIVIDILPEAHRKVVTYNSAKEHYIISFCEIKQGKLISQGHNTKQLKGELVKYICNKNSISLDDLKKFEHSLGYKYSEDNSLEHEIVYLKT